MKRNLFVIISCCLLIPLLSGCSGLVNKKGPFFGNGFRNGWADQHSIVIWTRLTKTPELNRTGPQFLLPSTDASKLEKLTDKDQIMQEQLPHRHAQQAERGIARHRLPLPNPHAQQREREDRPGDRVFYSSMEA